MLMYYILLTISLIMLYLTVYMSKMLDGATSERKFSKRLVWYETSDDHIMRYRTHLHTVLEDVSLPYCAM